MARVRLELPAGLNTDDTTYAAKGAWADDSIVRFREGRPQTCGGWEALSPTGLTGICRNLLQWTALSGALQVAFGTHSNLQLITGGLLTDITPLFALPAVVLAANPLSVTSGSALVTVSAPAHGLSAGSVAISGSVAVGGITPNGTFTIAIVDANTFTYTFTSNATSTASGGGSAVLIQPQLAFSAGQIDGTGGAGYGTGTYSTGSYSQPSTADYFPRTWSLSPYGGNMIAGPRGGTLYYWAGDPATKAATLTNAPAKVTCSLVNNQRQVMAFGCTPADGSAFDPLMIRWCDINGGITTWAPATNNNAGFVRLNGSGRIVGAMMCGDNVLVWTTAALYLGTYTGNAGALWTFERQGEHGGLIGPNAAAVVGQTAYWLSPSGQFYQYQLGGEPGVLPCPIRDDFVNNIASVQQDKIVASPVTKFGEIWWFYPDGRDGLENSRAIFAQPAPVNLLAPQLPTWSKAKLARTAFCDGDPSPYPIGVDFGGIAYFHEKGTSANGAPLATSLTSADQFMDDSQELMMVRGFWPDFRNQLGTVNVTIFTRLYPQAVEEVHGPYACAPGTTKIDMRATGRLVRVQFDTNSSPSSYRLGDPAFDVVSAGAR